jgi:hypothetical protein
MYFYEYVSFYECSMNLDTITMAGGQVDWRAPVALFHLAAILLGYVSL